MSSLFEFTHFTVLFWKLSKYYYVNNQMWLAYKLSSEIFYAILFLMFSTQNMNFWSKILLIDLE